jgi:hypothetical protein
MEDWLMKIMRLAILVAAAAATLGTASTVLAQRTTVGQTITAPGQTLTNSQGTWSLATDGATSAGYAVRLNGKDVGYAVSLTMPKDGLPVATHRDHATYKWTGSTFRPVVKGEK